MRKVYLILLGLCALFMGCGVCASGSAAAPGELIYFHYELVSTMRSSPRCIYEARKDKEGEVAIRVLTSDGKHNCTLTFPAERFMPGLERLIVQHKMKSWDGFAQSNNRMRDGSRFKFSATFADGTQINASGHNAKPQGYVEACEEFMTYFHSFLGIRNKE